MLAQRQQLLRLSPTQLTNLKDINKMVVLITNTAT